MLPVFAHFSKFSMYAWGKKQKLLVFTAVYVCVQAKLTLVRFFFNFFLHLSLTEFHVPIDRVRVCMGKSSSGENLTVFSLKQATKHKKISFIHKSEATQIILASASY